MRLPRFFQLCLSSFALTVCVLFPNTGQASGPDTARVADHA